MLFGFLLHTLSVPVIVTVGSALHRLSHSAELWFLRFRVDVQPLVAELREQYSIRKKHRMKISLHASSTPTTNIEENNAPCNDAFPSE